MKEVCTSWNSLRSKGKFRSLVLSTITGFFVGQVRCSERQRIWKAQRLFGLQERPRDIWGGQLLVVQIKKVVCALQAPSIRGFHIFEISRFSAAKGERGNSFNHVQSLLRESVDICFEDLGRTNLRIIHPISSAVATVFLSLFPLG